MGDVDGVSFPAPETATDVVCGRTVLPASAGLPLLFRGCRYWFCSQACRQAFKREPERHVEARPDAGVPAGPPPVERRSPFRVRAGPPPADDEPAPR
ncbi:MAG: YHS domain-containing protein [Deltaproteobacteria bacterium]|nr:YHS domain-containing protein [Deltaproteobacteria bacterium]MCB9785826.1 YHS domain-containing protein [Deltaproteobacteria bacterium]